MKGRRSDDGYVLVATLGVMLVLTGLIAASSVLAHSVLRGARTDAAAERLDALLRGGLEMTAYQLFTLGHATAAVNGRAIRFDDGAVTPQVTDEGGLIDVNAASPALLAGVLQAAGLDRQAAAEIVQKAIAFRGTPNAGLPLAHGGGGAQPQAPQAGAPPAAATVAPKPGAGANAAGSDGGAPASDAPLTPPDAVASPAATPAKTGFRIVAEFIAFAGVDRDEAAILSNLLTVMNPDGKLNVMVASRRALLALPDISDAAVDTLIADRRSATGAGLTAIKASLQKQKDMVKFEGGPCYRIHLTATDRQHRPASRDAVIAAGRSATDPFVILDWE